jgi:hypothetical protein
MVEKTWKKNYSFVEFDVPFLQIKKLISWQLLPTLNTGYPEIIDSGFPIETSDHWYWKKSFPYD